MSQTKIGVGLLLLAASSVLLFVAGGFEEMVRWLLAGGAALGLAAGSLLIGTSEGGRPV